MISGITGMDYAIYISDSATRIIEILKRGATETAGRDGQRVRRDR